MPEHSKNIPFSPFSSCWKVIVNSRFGVAILDHEMKAMFEDGRIVTWKKSGLSNPWSTKSAINSLLWDNVG